MCAHPLLDIQVGVRIDLQNPSGISMGFLQTQVHITGITLRLAVVGS